MKHSTLKRLYLFTLLAGGLSALAGCASVMKQLNEMANLAQCRFRLASVEDTALAGIPIQGETSASDLNPLDLLKVQRALAEGSLPLRFTLYLEADNPNASEAGLSRLQWSLFLDGNPMTSGVLDRQVEIAPNGGTASIPMGVTLDLEKVLSGKTLDSMVNLALAVAGEGKNPSRLTLKVKPSITVAGQTLDYPGEVTVTHEFGSK